MGPVDNELNLICMSFLGTSEISVNSFFENHMSNNGNIPMRGVKVRTTKIFKDASRRDSRDTSFLFLRKKNSI